MTEKVSEKKVIDRNVVIALGIICIVLAVGLVGAIANYTSIINGKDNTIATKNSTITSLNSQIETLTSQKSQIQTWLDGNKTLLSSVTTQRDQLQLWLAGNITSYQNQINSLNSQISSLNSTVTSLQNQISSLNSQIASLQSQISSLNAQIDFLNNQILNLTKNVSPNLIWIVPYKYATLDPSYYQVCYITNSSIDLGYTMVTSFSGLMVNLGIDAAYNISIVAQIRLYIDFSYSETNMTFKILDSFNGQTAQTISFSLPNIDGFYGIHYLKLTWSE